MAGSPIPGFKALAIGDSGTGKTDVIKTLIAAGITPMCVFTENSHDILGAIPADKLHWVYIKPVTTDIANLKAYAKKVGTMGPDLLQKQTDFTRDTTNQYYAILDTIANFKCQRTGQSFGDVTDWGTDKCFVLDSLSGLTLAAEKLGVGEKYAKTQPEFQIVMKTIENLIILITTGFGCHAYVTSHAEREMDEVNGGNRIFPATIGRKLAPVLPRYFTDVFMTKRNGMDFVWDTADGQAPLKARNLPISPKLRPGFEQLVNTWKSHGGIISPEKVIEQGDIQYVDAPPGVTDVVVKTIK